MSRTPISEFNARMGLDVSPLEQAVPRAIAQYKRLAAAQTALASSTTGGPDIQGLSEKLARAASSAGRLGLEGGGSTRFKNRADELDFTDPIGAANEESLKRRALREKELLDAQKSAIAAQLAETELVDAAMEKSAAEQMRRAQELSDYQESLAQRRLASAQAVNEFETQRSGLVSKSARESASVFMAEERAALDRVAAEKEILDIKRKQAQLQSTQKFERANPFAQQVMAVKELNRLIAARRGLERGTTAALEAQLAVSRQIAVVRDIRSNLTVGELDTRRLGTTALDSQKKMARFGLGMQQVGYQVQDYAVQVASGTNAMVALSQQGSQLLGFFGGFKGAMAGAALSVGILAYRMSGLSDETKKSASSVKTLTEVLEENIAARQKLDLLRNPDKEKAYLDKDLDSARKRVRDANQALAESQKKETDVGLQSRNIEIYSATAGLKAYSIAKLISIFREKSAKEAVTETGKALSEMTTAQVAAIQAGEEFNRTLDKTQSEARRNAFESYARSINTVEESLMSLASRNDTVFQRIRSAQEKLDGIAVFDKDSEAAYAEQDLVVAQLIAQAEDLAKGYKDQLDPLYKQRKIASEINGLRQSGLITEQEYALLQARIVEERERQLRLPEALRPQTGSAILGASNAPGQNINLLVDINKQMLQSLKTLVYQGAN
jgi:hypothetical protein